MLARKWSRWNAQNEAECTGAKPTCHVWAARESMCPPRDTNNKYGSTVLCTFRQCNQNKMMDPTSQTKCWATGASSKKRGLYAQEVQQAELICGNKGRNSSYLWVGRLRMEGCSWGPLERWACCLMGVVGPRVCSHVKILPAEPTVNPLPWFRYQANVPIPQPLQSDCGGLLTATHSGELHSHPPQGQPADND